MSAGDAPRVIDLARESRFQLGAVEVRPSTRELLVGDQRDVLEPRVMQVLVALARRHGEVVSRDDLVAACWGGRAVGEDAINRCIQAIRRLAETHGGFSIATVARVGYRLEEDALTFAKPALPLLAVLAFDNLSPDPDMSFFSDGVSEEILDTVGRGADLKVIGRASSFQFRGPDKAAAKVAAALKATHTLDGSVRRSGQHVRIAARLVDCASETTLWSGRFDRDLTDIFALQDEIATEVAAALKAEFARAGRRPGKLDPIAYDFFLRARDESSAQSITERIEMLEQCVTLAPDLADGWAWLAFFRMIYAIFDRGDLALEPLVGAARTALATAERLEPSMGFTRKVREALEPRAAYQRREALLREALRLTPGDLVCLTSAADLLGEVGRCREAFALAEEAKALNPLPPAGGQLQTDPSAVGRWITLLENYEEQSAQFDAMVAKYPALWWPSVTAATYAAAKGDWARYEALRGYAYGHPSATNAEPALLMRLTFGLYDAVRDRDQAYLDDYAKRLLARVERTGTVLLPGLWSAAQAGYADAAFQAVDLAVFDGAFVVGGPPITTWWAGTLFLRPFSAVLIDDPRFLRLCAKLGLVDYWLVTGRWPDCVDQVPYDFRAEARKVAAEGLARHV